MEDINSRHFITVQGYSRGFARFGFPEDQNTKNSKVRNMTVTGGDIVSRCLPQVSQLKHVKSYYISRVVSPFEFYLESDLDAANNEKLMEQMQLYYNRQEIEPIKYTIVVRKGKFYCCQHPVTGKWCRIQVHNCNLNYDFETEVEEIVSFRNEKNQVFAYFIDSLEYDYVSCDSLRDLNKEFQHHSSSMMSCYLYDVLPVHPLGFNWPMQAVTYFKQMAQNKWFHCVVMKWSRVDDGKQNSIPVLRCGVVLSDYSDESANLLNWIMVQKKLAQSSGAMASSANLLHLRAKAAYSEHDDAEGECDTVEDFSPSPISSQKLQEIVTRAVQHFSGKRVNDTSSSTQAENPQNYFPYSLRKKIAWIKLSHMEGPGKIFVHMSNKKVELSKMQVDIEKVVKTLANPLFKPGEVISCQMKDLKNPSSNCFTRAMILNPDLHHPDKITILLIDYGIIHYAFPSEVYRLPEKFRSIPSFVHRVHLENIRPMSGVDSSDLLCWTGIVVRLFTRYVISFEKDNPLYFAYKVANKEAIQFEDLNQELAFDSANNSWVANPMADQNHGARNEFINQMKDDPLLASYFCSIPVEIVYEVSVGECQPWKFDSLTVYVVENELGQYVKKPIDADAIHDILCNGFGSLEH